jgi:hypothetical protein
MSQRNSRNSTVATRDFGVPVYIEIAGKIAD